MNDRDDFFNILYLYFYFKIQLNLFFYQLTQACCRTPSMSHEPRATPARKWQPWVDLGHAGNELLRLHAHMV